MGAGVLYLVWLHPQLNALMEPETETLLDRRAFRALHKVYLWLCTVLWMVSLVWLGLSLPSPENKGAPTSSDGQKVPENAKGPQKLGGPNASAAQEA